VVLIHTGHRILRELDEKIANLAQQRLTRRGVEVIHDAAVTEVTAEGVALSNGQSISGYTVICTVGNDAHPLVQQCGLPCDRGRIVADEYLRVVGIPNVWAAGDAALIPDLHRGGFCPPTAQYAMREGVQCARNIMATIRHQPPQAFRFRGMGQLAVVGRHYGVARIFGIQFAGVLAWYLRRCFYLARVPGLRSKLRVGLDWILDALFFRDITMIELRRTEQLKRAHFRPGDVILRQGEIGDRFYIIESGEVEIIREEPGKADQRLGIRSAGTSFGEIALLKGVPRTATVRCLTSVDVIMLARHNFLDLIRTHKVIRAALEQEVLELLQNDSIFPR
jgi:NADH dehydrogenase